MNASQAGAIRMLYVKTPRDHLPASAGRVTMATACPAFQVSVLVCYRFLASEANILLVQSVAVLYSARAATSSFWVSVVGVQTGNGNIHL